MKNNKNYNLLNVKFICFSLLVLVLLFALSLSIFGAVKILSEFGKNIKVSVVGIFALILSSYLLFFTCRIVFIFISYILNDIKTSIKIDFENEILKINKNSNSYILNSKNIKLIEFHLSSNDYKSLMRYFGYIKLITIDEKELIITNFTLDYSIIENMFNDCKKIKKTNDIIYLP